MVSSDIYNSGYEFARKASDRKRKLLTSLTLLVPILILLTFFIGFISSLSVFDKTSETVTKVNTADAQEKESIARAKQVQQAYANAGLPYSDPQGRFTIDYVTPYISGDLVVVIMTEKEYDGAKIDADAVIAAMKSQVEITSVSYMKL